MAAKKKARKTTIVSGGTIGDMLDEEEDTEEEPGLTPVENDDVPLFLDAHGNMRRTITRVRIYKTNEPGSGFKGEVPATCDELGIFHRFGNGLYRAEAFSSAHSKPVRVRENIKIDVQDSEGTKETPPEQRFDAVEALNAAHRDETKRLDEMATRVLDQSRGLAEKHTDMVTKQTESAALRDREFFTNANKTQQTFFATLLEQQRASAEAALAQQAQQHQQAMESQREQFHQTLQLQQVIQQQNNPMALISVMMKGLELGRDMEGNSDPEWIQGLQQATGSLTELRKLAQIEALGKKLPAAKKVAVSTSNPKPAEKAEPSGDDLSKLTPEEKAKVMRLKAQLEKQGVDINTLLEQASDFYANGGADEPPEDDEQDGDESSTGKETGESHVDHPEPHQ